MRTRIKQLLSVPGQTVTQSMEQIRETKYRVKFLENVKIMLAKSQTM
ncbi:hypothetical protein NIES4072_43300 [Nostoc commune NIES-4072]|uniref:Uncharacterized protein n=1 Tax=Nostoc commune NIES-4072 TaxID=2005467 RepID=A0A2R5FRI4_NOSCO|nr:hypothetical protein [Nostoc commune]BBD68357.1 hypothetical protein NIES4070_47530 [Nostoc commune HK-02]GBG20649.1 hypothetical protein NIES4072_43300 [Nostoc commune NIES-4072]